MHRGEEGGEGPVSHIHVCVCARTCTSDSRDTCIGVEQGRDLLLEKLLVVDFVLVQVLAHQQYLHHHHHQQSKMYSRGRDYGKDSVPGCGV